MQKRGQITIFIIVALVIVGAIAIFFVFRGGIGKGGPLLGGGTAVSNPDAFLDTCLEDKISEGIEQISLRGGYLNPSLSMKFLFPEEGIYRNITYLCYTNNYHDPCKNQKPLLVRDIQNELENYISSEVEICFNELVSSTQDQGYEVSSQYNGFEVELEPKKVIAKINGEITKTRAEETSTIGNFEIAILSRVFDILLIVQDIVNAETLACDFNPTGHALLYPKFEIDITQTGDSLIYTIQYRETQEKFRFATRGCVQPPGI